MPSIKLINSNLGTSQSIVNRKFIEFKEIDIPNIFVLSQGIFRVSITQDFKSERQRTAETGCNKMR
jgi:hypothetical protein